jgi:nitrogen fixation protein NifB
MAEAPAQRPFRVAVASDEDGESVARFGHATRFLVYDLIGGDFFFAESRPVAAACGGGEGRHDQRLDEMAAIIDDCDVVLVREIGPGAVRILQRRSLLSCITSEHIDEALRSFAAGKPRAARPTRPGVKQ